MKLWIVGQAFNCAHCASPEGGRCWEFAGVFDSEEKAVAACREANYFVSPYELNAVVPHESVQAPNGSYYPKQK